MQALVGHCLSAFLSVRGSRRYVFCCVIRSGTTFFSDGDLSIATIVRALLKEQGPVSIIIGGVGCCAVGVVLYCVSRIPYPSAVCGWDLGRNPYIVFRNRILCWWQLGLSTPVHTRRVQIVLEMVQVDGHLGW